MISYLRGETIYLEIYGENYDIEACDFNIYVYQSGSMGMIIPKSQCHKVDTNHYEAAIYPHDSALMNVGTWSTELWILIPDVSSLKIPKVVIRKQDSQIRIEDSVAKKTSLDYIRP